MKILRFFEQLAKYGGNLVALADRDLESGPRSGGWLNARWRDHVGGGDGVLRVPFKQLLGGAHTW